MSYIVYIKISEHAFVVQWQIKNKVQLVHLVKEYGYTNISKL